MARVLASLDQAIPAPRVELDYRTPFELLVATILSAQCTDQRVNLVTPALFRRYRSPAELAEAKPIELESLIRSTGFFKSKARNLTGCARALVERFGGEVPRSVEELVTLAGVGRKTANVILGQCFHQPAIVVDTHVKRVATRLELTKHDDADRIEQDLRKILPQEAWTTGSQRLLLHGRYVCLARAPRCPACPIAADCPWEGKRTS
jgi:endonuclease-3